MDANVAPAAQALLHFTEELLDNEVWLRPGLSPRDRGLATIASLAAQGLSDLLPTYLERALASGVVKEEVGELLAHVAFYGGWGNAIQAAAVVSRSCRRSRSDEP